MSDSRRPTMRDVAAEAGVSFKTVSRVVNGELGVSTGLVERVQQAVTDLGYRPDHRARHLRQAGPEATTIGFVLVDVANPFFSNILRGIEAVAMARGCLVLAGSTEGSPGRERQLVETLVERRVAGLIVVSSGAAAITLRAELERGTPIVFLDLEPDMGLDTRHLDLVRTDHRAGAVLATSHLIAHGHRDIAYFGDDAGVFSAGLRLEGFHAAMTAADLPVGHNRVLAAGHTEDEWTRVIGEYLTADRHPPTAIFTAQNYVTIGAVRALHRLGLRSTVAHVGFDDVDLADVVTPGISVVPQQPRQLGRRAADLIFSRLDGNTDPPRAQILGATLVERGSGELVNQV